MPPSVTPEQAKGSISHVERTLLSAAVDVAFDLRAEKNQNQIQSQRRRTGVSALHAPFRAVPHPCALLTQEPALSEAEGVGIPQKSAAWDFLCVDSVLKLFFASLVETGR
jgi:hypothetical protein